MNYKSLQRLREDSEENEKNNNIHINGYDFD